MSLTFERKLPIILFFVFLMLTTVGVVFYQNTASFQDTIRSQQDAQMVVSSVDETVAHVFEIQTALINFINVSNPTYLEPFERAKPRIRQNIEKLRAAMADDPAQLEEINRIDQICRQYVSEVSRKVDLRKIEGTRFPEVEKVWTEGQRMLEQIRASGERIKQTVRLRQHEKDLDATRRSVATVWVLIVSSLAGIVSLGLANLTVLSEIKKRKSAQLQLIELNEGLEKKVEDRTAELKLANDKLLAAGVERESILYSEKEARQEAEIANRLRDEFMATVSHELRTPLNSILGWARMMKAGNLDEAQSEKALTTIIKNSETQNRLIEDLMDVARVISGKLELQLEELDLADVVAQAVETVKPTADSRVVPIDLIARRGEAVVRGDNDRLVQVFTNLLGNAVKFSPEGSPVFVTVAAAGDNAIVVFNDRGKGISPEFLPLVFERFRQDLKNRGNNGGLGLGLAIVRNLVEMHGGTVRAESEGEGCGAVFTVTLPLSEGSSSAGEI
jgi:signal transduction histidine kinase